MKNLFVLLHRAQTSRFWRVILNLTLWRAIPFNWPHRLWIRKVATDTVEIGLPYRRSNLNHLRGLHACSMATAAEYASGLLLLSYLDAAEYRLIMKEMSVKFLFQGKKDSVARCTLSPDWIREQVIAPSKTQEKIEITVKVQVQDNDSALLAEASVVWQVKRWDAVKTRSSKAPQD